MIGLARIDERLVHGQVLVGWVPHLGARRVVVADDEASRSPLARAAMTLALPPGVEAAVEPIGVVDWDALAGSAEPVLVVLRGAAEVERAFAAGMTPARVPVLNVGNVHHSQEDARSPRRCSCPAPRSRHFGDWPRRAFASRPARCHSTSP